MRLAGGFIGVLIHCLAGAHRAGTTSVAYLMHKTGKGPKEATVLAKRRRPVINPRGRLVGFLRRFHEDLLLLRQEKGTPDGREAPLAPAEATVDSGTIGTAGATVVGGDEEKEKDHSNQNASVSAGTGGTGGSAADDSTTTNNNPASTAYRFALDDEAAWRSHLSTHGFVRLPTHAMCSTANVTTGHVCVCVCVCVCGSVCSRALVARPLLSFAPLLLRFVSLPACLPACLPAA